MSGCTKKECKCSLSKQEVQARGVDNKCPNDECGHMDYHHTAGASLRFALAL